MSVAIPREPQRPAFRAPPRDAASRGPDGEDGEAIGDGETQGPQMVTDVHGIGPVYATRLEAAGVTTLSDLASSDPDEIANAAEVPLSRAEEWVKAAGTLLEA